MNTLALRRRLPAVAGCVACALLISFVLAITVSEAEARNNIRSAFFAIYTTAVGSKLDNLPSKTAHCGVCHFDFNGSGPKNFYGNAVAAGIAGGMTSTQAINAIHNSDSDGDGYANAVEITDVTNYVNTPTFPGLNNTNKTSVVNIPLAEVDPYVTPVPGTDTTPPVVTVGSPKGGEAIAAAGLYTISYTATDAGGVGSVSLYLSDDNGATYEPVALSVAPGTTYSWFVPNLPGTVNKIKIAAWDIAGNMGLDESNAGFTIIAQPPGYVPSTIRDLKMSGTQPHMGAILDNPTTTCVTCHGNYDTTNEMWFNQRGSLMGQAARDPFFYACMTIAEQDAPSVGDVCIRCHTPGGWQEGRSVDTDGGLLNEKDRHGVQCDFCHRAVDFNYVPGVSPAEDAAVLAAISPLPLQYGNGQFINDPLPIRRGPYSDPLASHAFAYSPFHKSADLCGTCHDVSNPAFSNVGPGDYAPNAFDAEHPDMNLRNMMPVERTYSEWAQSDYAAGGVYAPQFAGAKPSGIVSTCQDCHMRDVVAYGSNVAGTPLRTDLALHDLTGGNTFVTDIVASFFPGEVDAAQLAAAKARATGMIQLAATLELTPQTYGVDVKVTNETGHKLPSGYPEGRRVWINVKAFDSGGSLVFESGAYNFGTAELAHDSQTKIYEVHPGLSPSLAAALGMPAGPSFHFVLSDTVYTDNRIPPRGFTNAGFASIQSPPVHYAYADGQHWDVTPYELPATADSVWVTVYYQTTTKEYIEFLRDANTTNSAGQDLHSAWIAQGMAPPVAMAQAGVKVDIPTGTEGPPLIYGLAQNYPNPFNPVTSVAYSIAAREHVRIAVYDVTGAKVRTLVDRVQEPSRYTVAWDGKNDAGKQLTSGVYFIRYQAGAYSFTKKAVLLR